MMFNEKVLNYSNKHYVSLTAITKGVVSIKPSCRYQAAITAVTKGIVDIDYTHRKGVIVMAGKNRAKNSVFIDKTGETLTGHVQLTNEINANETDKIVTADTDILSDYTTNKTVNTTLMVMTDTAGVLKLKVNGKIGSLNGGIALDVDKWYAFDIPVLATSVYNLRFSVDATLQINWIGGN